MLVSFGEQLIAVGYKIHVYSPFTKSWVYVGDTPNNDLITYAITVNEELMLLYLHYHLVKARGKV